MTISAARIASDLDALGVIEPAFARARAAIGPPAPRDAARGHGALLRIIVGQQVSIASAAAVFGRLRQLLGEIDDPAALLARSDADLRGVGLSRQKIAHARSLAAHVQSGALAIAHLPGDDEAAIAQLVAVKGIGRWSAEVYLLIAEARHDIWPAGDLGVRIGVGRLLGLAERPDEKRARALAETWRPYRSAAALMAWHYYSAPPL